jgi:hypothetical protein
VKNSRQPAHIKEPKGVDFIIKSEPLTNEERAALSEFIRHYKEKRSDKGAIKKEASFLS